MGILLVRTGSKYSIILEQEEKESIVIIRKCLRVTLDSINLKVGKKFRFLERMCTGYELDFTDVLISIKEQTDALDLPENQWWKHRDLDLSDKNSK